jgi:hypothetical protein
VMNSVILAAGMPQPGGSTGALMMEIQFLVIASCSVREWGSQSLIVFSLFVRFARKWLYGTLYRGRRARPSAGRPTGLLAGRTVRQAGQAALPALSALGSPAPEAYSQEYAAYSQERKSYSQERTVYSQEYKSGSCHFVDFGVDNLISLLYKEI